MVLTRRAHRLDARMCITLWLPNELLTKIIHCSPKSDQATLCRVSKLFYALVLPILNRAVVLNFRKDDKSCDHFSRALIKVPQRAEAIRSLTLTPKPSHPNRLVQGAYDLLFEAMELMQGLQSITLEKRWEKTTINRLDRLVLPQLSTLRLRAENGFGCPDARAFSQFFAQHPSITRLYLPADSWLTVEPVHNFLPNLREYVGPTPLLRSLATQSLRAARLCPDSELSASNVQTLKALTKPGLPFVLSIDPGLGNRTLEVTIPAILSAVSTEMSSEIRSLELRTFETGRLSTETFNHITTQLLRFSHIAYFSIARSDAGYLGEFFVDIEAVQAALRAWATALPTLKGCFIGCPESPDACAWIKVGEQWERCTMQDFDVQAGFSIFEDADT
ncbi:hypothetical protein FB45DRAFT_308212 [Roridomyces roridus]|uniref:F-box domain-containing protein n=1 Tax=Roridomyces roridus TaxID=1738132 RepID=A0AAD7B791_9AGAR|nr:hypothetical protein FB45DRAFT_308212 [Roridomyces roridus]